MTFSVKNTFKDRNAAFYLALTAFALLLASSVIYLVYSLIVKLFEPYIFIVSLVGALSFLLVAFTNLKHAQILPTVLAMATFALYLDDRLEMFVLMASGVYGMSETGAILELVVFILAMQLVSFVLFLISCFFYPRKSAAVADGEKRAAYIEAVKREKTEIRAKQDQIVSEADVPVTCRMLSGKSKAKLVAGGAVALAVVLVGSGLVGYQLNGGGQPQGEAPEQVKSYGITISSLPEKLEYNEGEYFNSDGLGVTIYNSDGTSSEVQGWYTSVDGKALEVSDSVITVAYQDFSATMKVKINEAAVSGTFSSDTYQFKFKENGVVQVSESKGDYTSVGTWKNAGSALFVTIDGTETQISSYMTAYFFNYKNERVVSQDLKFKSAYEFTGPTQYGAMAGNGTAILSEDGLAKVSQSGRDLASGTWYKEGQTIYVTLGSNVYTATFADGKYTLLCSASAMGYTFNYTMTEVTSDKPDTPPVNPDQPSEKTVYMTMAGEGHGGAEGRKAVLSLNDDGTLKLEWIYTARDYVMATYEGTWEEKDGAMIVHISEKDGTTSDYTCSLDGNVYSFVWAKDHDTSDPDYCITISGEKPVAEDPVFMTMTGEGHGGAEGRKAVLTLNDDGTLKLEWIYTARDYVMASYEGAWVNAGSGKITVTIHEKDGSKTDYALKMDASTYSQGYITYSFTWNKDNDASDPDYCIAISGKVDV